MAIDNATSSGYTHGMDLSQECPSMSETIRQCVLSSGMTYRQLARQAGIDISQFSKFMRPKQSMTLPKIEQLCSAIGLELRPRGGGRQKKRA